MLKIKNLAISFNRYGSWFAKKKQYPIKALDLEVKKGEIMAIVGESGAGKSLLAHAILGLLPTNANVSGEIFYKQERLTPKMIKQLRGKEITLIPQSVAFLNPLWSAGAQVVRAAKLSGKSRKASKQARDKAFKRYELDHPVKKMFPFQISGGMARRVLTASAVVGDARLIIADEPTTGLDDLKSRQSLKFLHGLAKTGRTVLLITHDIKAALEVADRVAVFRNGVTVEIAKTSDFSDISSLRHPYTRQLYNSLPENSFTFAVNGRYPGVPKKDGCVFVGECPLEQERCYAQMPSKRNLRNGLVRCHYAAD